jgi:molybdopterin-guanine dinucleotide biosynthesis protein A
MTEQLPIQGFSGVVLAGGKGRRLGGAAKAFITIDRRTIIESTLGLFQGLFREIVVVTNTPLDFIEYEGVRTVSDIIPGCGPAGGIHAGLLAITSPMAFVVACDMPFLGGGLIRRMCAAAISGTRECLVPRSFLGIEPLHAVYSKGLADRFERMLSGGTRRIADIINGSYCGWYRLDGTDLRAMTNINTAADLESLRGCLPPVDPAGFRKETWRMSR